MSVTRALYLTFFVFFLITLAIAMWFILSYAKVPGWVYSFFIAAILIAFVTLFVREFLTTRKYDCRGIVTNAGSVGFWSVFNLIMYITAFILLILGLAFVIKYSTVPWWVWVVLGTGIILLVISDLILSYAPNAWIWAMLVGLLAFATLIAAIVLMVIYIPAPWWVWSLVGLAVVFAILAAIFSYFSEATAECQPPRCAEIAGCDIKPIAPVKPTTTCRIVKTIRECEEIIPDVEVIEEVEEIVQVPTKVIRQYKKVIPGSTTTRTYEETAPETKVVMIPGAKVVRTYQEEDVATGVVRAVPNYTTVKDTNVPKYVPATKYVTIQDARILGNPEVLPGMNIPEQII